MMIKNYLTKVWGIVAPKRIALLLLIGATLSLVACRQDEGALYNTSPPSPATGDKETYTHSLELAADFASDDATLRSLIFSGKKGNVPKIAGIKTEVEGIPTELKLYLISQQGSATPIRHKIWSLKATSEETLSTGGEGFAPQTLSSGGVGIHIRAGIPDEVFRKIQASGDDTKWYVGGMLNGRTDYELDGSGCAYAFAQDIRVGSKMLDTRPNARITQRIAEGDSPTAEERNIPLASPITAVSRTSLLRGEQIQLRFKPRGILINFKLKNNVTHRAKFKAISVYSPDLALQGSFSLLDIHLTDPQTGKLREFPLMLNETNSGDFSGGQTIRPSGTTRFPLYASDGSEGISLDYEQTAEGEFCIWALPTGTNSHPQLHLKLHYELEFNGQKTEYETKEEIFVVKNSEGVREGASQRMRSPLAIRERFPEDIGEADLKDWMQYIPDHTPLNYLSLIGTHDAAANSGWATSAGQTQASSIADQLKEGVRILDLRLKRRNDKLGLYHGPIFLHLHFKEDILDVSRKFLEENPSEFVIFIIKNEGDRDENELRQRIIDQLNNYSRDYPRIIHNGALYSTTQVGELRGRIAFISRSGYLGRGAVLHNIGNDKISTPTLITLGSNHSVNELLYFCDMYRGGHSWEAKQNQIKDGIHKAMRSDFSGLVINHLSQAYSFLYPPHRLSETYNPYTADYLYEFLAKERDVYPLRSGFLMLDYSNGVGASRLRKILTEQSIKSNNANYRKFKGVKTPGYVDNLE